VRSLLSLAGRSRWTSLPSFKVDEGDQPTIARTGTLLLAMQRRRLLRYLPSGGHIAEIGVARGQFSRQIRSVCKPSFLVLIDPWMAQAEKEYFRDTNNVGQTDQDRRYNKVQRSFASKKPGRECRVLRTFSVDASRHFEDGTFDWVFIDGNHSFEACLEDLRVWAPKVKDDGLICGHDFAAHASARNSRYGVVEAVSKFLSETGHSLAALTVEHFPTFVIAKQPAGPTATRMRHLILSHEPHVIQLERWMGSGFHHARIKDTDASRSAFVSIDMSPATSSSDAPPVGRPAG
jgi:hypothetical protein